MEALKEEDSKYQSPERIRADIGCQRTAQGISGSNVE
jgi:hypothetical protein